MRRSVVALLAVLSGACAAARDRDSSAVTSQAAIDLSSVPVSSGSAAAPPPLVTASSRPPLLHRVGDSEVGILEPPGSTATFDSSGYVLEIGADRVEVTVVDEPAPGTIDEAVRDWPRSTKRVGQAGRAGDVIFVVTCFDVRVGVPSPIPGQHIHRLKEVCRVYAALPLGSSRSARCIGYFEHPGENDPPGLALLREVCSSMAVMTKR